MKHIIFLSILCLIPAMAQAEWYMAADLLQSRYAGPSTDGTWKQEHLPARHGHEAVTSTTQSLTWDVGAGYRFASLWSIEAGYRHYGSGVSAGGLAVSDHVYRSILDGLCDPKTVTPGRYEATDHLEGGYLRLSKGFDVGYGLQVFGIGGVEVLYHDLNFWSVSSHGRVRFGGFTGVVAGPTAGGGIKYQLDNGIAFRVLAESRWMVTESGNPISSQWITVGGGVEVPLVWR